MEPSASLVAELNAVSDQMSAAFMGTSCLAPAPLAAAPNQRLPQDPSASACRCAAEVAGQGLGFSGLAAPSAALIPARGKCQSGALMLGTNSGAACLGWAELGPAPFKCCLQGAGGLSVAWTSAKGVLGSGLQDLALCPSDRGPFVCMKAGRP